MTQHGYPYPESGQYGQGPQYPPASHTQPPSAGYAVPPGTPGYGHAGYPPAGGFAGQQNAGYASQQPTAPNGQELADVWMRLVARLVDGLIVGGVLTIIAIPIMIVVFVVSLGSLETDANGNTTGGLSFLVVVLVSELVVFLLAFVAQYVYDVEMCKRTGQTVGKRIMKLRVTPLDPNLPLDRGVLAKRWLVSGLGGLVPGLSLLNPLWCLWDQPYRQCLHDKFAKTVVVKVPA
ncbi:RDD family protein [Virgisporangium aurantiacum]|uniref:RDD family protein n=1 Tax=Virgisporangium aurantiacum TaxID=175570 RepID=UPI00194ED896|nr:RDD family protein [Virgisporangium aurantiacum]